jgi:hypothetical protein
MISSDVILPSSINYVKDEAFQKSAQLTKPAKMSPVVR